jgi:hypothetical protein
VNIQHVTIYILSIGTRQGLGTHVPSARNTHNNRRIVGSFVFYTVRIVSKQSLWVCQCITLSLQGKGSVNTFPWQRGIVEGVILYAIHVVSKESRRLGLARISCQLPVINTTHVAVFRICELGAVLEILSVRSTS